MAYYGGLAFGVKNDVIAQISEDHWHDKGAYPEIDGDSLYDYLSEQLTAGGLEPYSCEAWVGSLIIAVGRYEVSIDTLADLQRYADAAKAVYEQVRKTVIEAGGPDLGDGEILVFSEHD